MSLKEKTQVLRTCEITSPEVDFKAAFIGTMVVGLAIIVVGAVLMILMGKALYRQQQKPESNPTILRKMSS